MANQCVSELSIIGSEEVVREILCLMVSNLIANKVSNEDPPCEDETVQQLAEWISKYTREPLCCYLESLSCNVWSRPMGWDAEVLIAEYGELFTLRMDFDTANGPAMSEVEDFIEAIPSPCGVYFRPDTDYRHRDIWLKKDGGRERSTLSSKFNRFKKWGGEIDVFYAQMHKTITNKLPKVK